MSILIVEDHPQVGRLLDNFFSSHGGMCTSAKTGNEALSIAEATTHFDAITLDVNLPDGSGIRLASRLRARFPEAIIVALTGRFHEPDRDQALASGCNAYLAKPFPLEALWSMLTAVPRTPADPESNSWGRMLPHNTTLTATLLDRLSKPTPQWTRALAKHDWRTLQQEVHLRRNDALLSGNTLLMLASERLETATLARDPTQLAAAEALWTTAVVAWLSPPP